MAVYLKLRPKGKAKCSGMAKKLGLVPVVGLKPIAPSRRVGSFDRALTAEPAPGQAPG